ncbi:uncharacterized protein B0H64DRAFT_119405 [Chaetomium fimeti]|uniref:Nephrocystin 3-like N-terminal domain-containing protein n=1 Tax=Chaetomium fimeti TaxID=1854472 RepID=A0AAE0HK95_9PEZI|nr:hypothetical protein B0H64DRAFT_119405 [Chaetomium fimeti]
MPRVQDEVAQAGGWGLNLVHDGSGEGDAKQKLRLDIVLVHGLGGDPNGSWITKNGFLWAKNALSPSIPNLRVFVYGYSGTPNSTCNKTTAQSIAINLLGLLTDHRGKPHLESRPLILAGHNLGGNIIKHVLVVGNSRRSYRDIRNSICGFLFFATPHKGLDARTFNKFMMLNKPRGVRFRNNPPSELLEEMDRNYRWTDNLSNLFRMVADDIPHLRVLGLLEGAYVPRMKEVIVNDASGSLDWANETVTKLDGADHIQICKLGGGESDTEATNNGVRVLAQQIHAIVTNWPKPTTLEDKNGRALQRLGISKMQPSPRPVVPAEGTCESAAQECFDNWPVRAEDGNFSTLWVRGPEGCGKAHLAKHMAERWRNYRRPNSSGPQHRAIVAHCSVSDMAAQYRTASCVAVCWLREILDAQPTSVSHLTTKFEKEVNDFGQYVCEWREARIVHLWQEVILAVADEVDLVFVVDGVDKCHDAQAAVPTLLDWVAEVALKAAESPRRKAQFQVLVFSNDSEEFRHLNQIPVHQLSTKGFENDVKCAVRDRVKAILHRYGKGKEPDETRGPRRDGEVGENAGGAGESELERLLWKTISGGEEKTHLWAAVLVGEIEAANFSDKAVLIKFLDFLNNSPEGGKFDALYRIIIERIFSTGGGLARHSLNVLFWVMHHIGAINAEELQTGCGLLDAAGFAQADSGDEPPERHIQEVDVERTRVRYSTLRWAVQNCGGLIKGWPRGLCLIHDSFRKFFTTCKTSIHQHYRCSQEHADKLISRLCGEYLLLPRFSNAGPSVAVVTAQERNEWEDKVHNRIKKNKFVRYASLRWTEHLQRSGSPFKPRHMKYKKRSRFQRLFDPETGYMRNWTEVLWFWTKSAEGVTYPARNFPWELFVWKKSKHWRPEPKLPRLPPPQPPSSPPSSPPGAQPGSQPGSPPGLGYSDGERPILDTRSPEAPNEGKGSKETWWRKKRVWFVIAALVVIVIGGTVGGTLGSRRSS